MHQLEWHKFPQICRVQCMKTLYNREEHNRDFWLVQTRMLAKWIQPFTLYKATTTLGSLIILINRQFVRHIASSINSPNNESELNIVFFFSLFRFRFSLIFCLKSWTFKLAKETTMEKNIRRRSLLYGNNNV